MNTQTLLPLLLAILSPFVWGLMNILDKTVVSNKVKNPLSFAVVAGLANLLLGITLALFLKWDNVSARDCLFPVISGLILGTSFFVYYKILDREDVSDLIGFIYFYPIIIALLSFLFLREILPLVGYLGVALILSGVLVLSFKGKQTRTSIGFVVIFILILMTALYEFSIKIATTSLPEMNGAAITSIFVGLATLPGLFNKNIRSHFPKELKNLGWSLMIESFTLVGILTTYFAMAGLQATTVSSIAASQPLTVLILESAANKMGLKISQDTNYAQKAFPIILIVLGVLLLSLFSR